MKIFFKRQLTDSFGSSQETKLWLDIAYDCKYLEEKEYNRYKMACEEICKKLTKLIDNWKTY